MAGSQTGTGIFSVADWWLAMGRAVEEETEAAAAPAKTMAMAMMRIVSFIVGNLSRFCWLGIYLEPPQTWNIASD
jgi:hypothetical protein